MLIATYCSLLFSVATLSVAILPVANRDVEREILQPFSAVSPSGAWRLEVEPSDRFGVGEGIHRVTHNGVVQHTTTLPYTFHVAAITDEGFAVGIRDLDLDSRRGKIMTCVLGPDGEPVRDEERRRKWKLHPVPTRSLLLDPDGESWVLAFGGKNVRPRMWSRFPLRTSGEPERSTGDPPSELLASRSGLGPDDQRLPARDPDSIPTRELTSTSSTRLLAGDNGGYRRHPLLHLQNFGFTSDGAPIAIRTGQEGSVSAITFAADGSEYREDHWEPLPAELEDHSISAYWIGDSRWLLYAESWFINAADPRWFLAHVGQPRLHRLPALDDSDTRHWSSIRGVAGIGNGSFVLLLASRPDEFMAGRDSSRLVAFDNSGELLWETPGTEPAALNSPAKVASSPDGTIAVLDSHPGRVRLFSNQGDLLQNINLKAALGPTHAPTLIHSDPNADFMIEELGEQSTCWPLTSNGYIGEPSSQKHSIARGLLNYRRNRRVGPNGAMWANDEVSIIEYGEDGEPSRVFSHTPVEETLIRPGPEVQIDALGRAWVLNELSGDFIRFTSEGRHDATIPWASQDETYLWADRKLAHRSDGGVLIERGRSVTRFDDRGQRLRDAPDPAGKIVLELPGDRFVVSHPLEPLQIVNAEGEIVESIDKLPDGRWSGPITDAVWTADGKAALLGDDLILLDEQGRPHQVIRLPLPPQPHFQSLYMNGDRALVANLLEENAMLYTFSEDRWERLIFPDLNTDHPVRGHSFGLSPDGETVLAIDWITHTLHRYPLK